MYKTVVDVDDRCLVGKSVINRKDVKRLLPEEIQKKVYDVRVCVDCGQPRWVLPLSDDVGGYQYHPFSHEMVYDPNLKKTDFGKIYLWRKARYLRDKYEHRGTDKRIFTVFVCRPGRMYFLREVKQYWFDDGTGMGCCSKSRWFTAFP